MDPGEQLKKSMDKQQAMWKKQAKEKRRRDLIRAFLSIGYQAIEKFLEGFIFMIGMLTAFWLLYSGAAS